LFIADEVVTAFGRLGHMFATEEVFGVIPDMLTFAKGVTSGYFPQGGVAISEALHDQLDDSNAVFSHGFTYSNHPAGCAAALANIEILEEGGVLDNVQHIEHHFQNTLRSLLDLPIVTDVRGMGLMACIECSKTPDRADPYLADADLGKRVDWHCQELGLIVRPLVNMCVLSPPLVVTESQVDKIVAILREGILRTMADLESEGLWNR
jgi:adenosylmethionine-8-amino-7-oxononanoate aminotransferase